MNRIRRIIKKSWLLYSLSNHCYSLFQKIRNLNSLKVINKGLSRLEKDVRGSNNTIEIGENSILNKVKIYIRGNGNKIVIGKNCRIYSQCSFWMEGNGIQIILGDNTSVQYMTHFCAQENNRRIILGNNCMISNKVTFRTSDSHSILDAYSEIRLNPPKDIKIGNHVWVAAQAIILKGADIGDNCIIGSRSVVTKVFPANCLAVGMPAIIVKKDVTWDRKLLRYDD